MKGKQRMSELYTVESSIVPDNRFAVKLLQFLSINNEFGYTFNFLKEELEISENELELLLSEFKSKQFIICKDEYYHINNNIVTQIQTVLGDMHQREILFNMDL